MEIEIYNSSTHTDVSIVKNMLLGYGIESEIRDDGIVTANWLYSNAVQGIKLFVHEDDVLTAQKYVTNFLNETIEEAQGDQFILSDEDEYDTEDVCPQCKSVKIKKASYYYRTAVFFVGAPLVYLLNSTIAIVVWIAIVIGLSFFKSKARCYSCKHRWVE
ncbi:MAG: hypothetical protein OCD76_09420 [Reichenbachiella sp.]